MVIRQSRTILGAVYALYADSGFAMAGAVAYAFVLSLFPFCIFLGAVAGYFGGEALAKQGIAQLFQIAPAPVAEALAPEVMRVMGQSRFGLLTIGALIALFFATSAIESLRAALNIAYRQKEARSYFRCLLQSSIFVVLSALGMLVLTWSRRQSETCIAAMAGRPELVRADGALWDRRGCNRLAVVRLSPVARRRQSPSVRCLARGVAEHRAVDVGCATIWLLADNQRLFALLCRAHSDHERTSILSGDSHHCDTGSRTEPRIT
jgi:hypothetical protein